MRLLIIVCIGLGWALAPASAQTCTAGSPDAIACENSLPGNSKNEWQILGIGDETVQGFATEISVNRGEEISFKIDTSAPSIRIDIYRLGYYAGHGARKIATIPSNSVAAIDQPECISDTATGLLDCGNWSISATWTVPTTAVSGIYLARPVRDDTDGASHILFVVRDDDGGSAVLMQTSDTTWQAYNSYGGLNLYNIPTWAPRAYKVSYNRPMHTRGQYNFSFFFSAEYPMVRWLERNGYDVSYTSGVDTDRRGTEILEHQVFLSVGHDEYWSADQRRNVESARSAGVHLAFFSGNEVFWKTRWEPAIDGSQAPYRTLVCYKETKDNSKIDPSPAWTGTWRDARFSPPSDGGLPENALTGTIFTVQGPVYHAIKVPAEYGRMRLWRDTDIANMQSGEVSTLPTGTLGYEWDEDLDNGARPAGLVHFSSTVVAAPEHGRLVDSGYTYAPFRSATHNLTLYRHSSGALVFGAGTVQWSWGLDDDHDYYTFGPSPIDSRMQQATVNLLADMGVTPLTVQPGLLVASASSDHTPPETHILSPSDGAIVLAGEPLTVMGTATDSGGGLVNNVEVSVDGGETWHRASGREQWTYSFIPAKYGATMIMSRAVDDSANLEPSPSSRTLEIGGSVFAGTINIETPAYPDSNPVEVGVRFKPVVDGRIAGVRFYKGPGNSGPHLGRLWTADGVLLGGAQFEEESAVGWQTVFFPSPIEVTAGQSYVASYFAPTGHYAVDRPYFTTDRERFPLRMPASVSFAPNGLYKYGGGFPSETTAPPFHAPNYWVDIVFLPDGLSRKTLLEDSLHPESTSYPDAIAEADGVELGVKFRTDSPGYITGIRFFKGPGNEGEHHGHLWIDGASTPLASTNFPVESESGWQEAGFLSLVPAVPNTTYVMSYFAPVGHYSVTRPFFTSDYTRPPLTAVGNDTQPPNGAYQYGGGLPGGAFHVIPAPNYFVDVVFHTVSRNCPCTLFGDEKPGTTAYPDSSAVELGVKVQIDINGFVSGVRFYKGAGNNGTHVGRLWTESGVLLAEAEFENESATGWQEVLFPSRVAIPAGTTVVVSYFAPHGHYAVDRPYFVSEHVALPLRALADGHSGPNGIYRYGEGFPVASPWPPYHAPNYWVDLVFETE